MKIKIWIEHWIAAWLDMLCGFVCIITFCYYRPWWDFKFRIWADKKNINNLKFKRGIK